MQIGRRLLEREAGVDTPGDKWRFSGRFPTKNCQTFLTPLSASHYADKELSYACRDFSSWRAGFDSRWARHAAEFDGPNTLRGAAPALGGALEPWPPVTPDINHPALNSRWPEQVAGPCWTIRFLRRARRSSQPST